MIYYGTCVGPNDDYAEFAGPSLERTATTPAAVLTRRGATSIATAYNQLIDEALRAPDAEALVLIHDDVRIDDPNFETRVRRRLGETDIGVIGVVGAANLHNMRYWEGRPRFGRVRDRGGVHRFGPPRGDVDAVDGLLMVLSRAALERVRFDEELVTAFQGYDADYCLATRAAGLRVVVEPFRLYHDSPGAAGADFVVTEQAFVRKWSPHLSPPPAQDQSRLARSIAVRRRRLTSRLTTVMPHPGRSAAAGTAERLAWIEAHIEGGIVLVMGDPDLAAAARAVGFDAFAVSPERASAGSIALDEWRLDFPGFVADAVVWFDPLEGRLTALERCLGFLSPAATVLVEQQSDAADSLDSAGLEVVSTTQESGSVSARRYCCSPRTQ